MDASNADMSAVIDAKFALVELSWSYESVGAGINIISGTLELKGGM